MHAQLTASIFGTRKRKFRYLKPQYREVLHKLKTKRTYSDISMSPVEAWLSELKEGVRWRYLKRLQDFCEWYGKSPEDIQKDYKNAKDKRAWRKKIGSAIVSYYQHRLSEGYKINSARSDTIPIRSFLSSQCGGVLGHYSVERAERQDHRKNRVIYTSLNKRERAC